MLQRINSTSSDSATEKRTWFVMETKSNNFNRNTTVQLLANAYIISWQNTKMSFSLLIGMMIKGDSVPSIFNLRIVHGKSRRERWFCPRFLVTCQMLSKIGKSTYKHEILNRVAYFINIPVKLRLMFRIFHGSFSSTVNCLFFYNYFYFCCTHVRNNNKWGISRHTSRLTPHDCISFRAALWRFWW